MAEAVIDGLELVEIEIQQGEHRATAPCVADHAVQVLLEAMAVVETGEGVVLGEVGQLCRGLAFLGDVFEDPQPTYDAATRLSYRVGLLGQGAAVLQFQFQGFIDGVLVRDVENIPGCMFRTSEP